MIEKNNRIKRRLPAKVALLLFLMVFVFPKLAMAQLLCEMEPATTDVAVQESNRLVDAIIVGVAVIIVLFTLIMSIKYLFKPGENNPDHIKNIVRDEGF